MIGEHLYHPHHTLLDYGKGHLYEILTCFCKYNDIHLQENKRVEKKPSEDDWKYLRQLCMH